MSLAYYSNDTFNNHWVNVTAGERFVHENITRAEVNRFVLTRTIIDMFIFCKFTVYKMFNWSKN